MFAEEDLRSLSAVQHLLFCERQCALIHGEQVWAENRFTAEGKVLHERVDRQHHEHRRRNRTEFSLAVRSLEWGLSGICDQVEFVLGEAGGYESMVPVEFKRGTDKQTDEDRVQLCAQALCLEEMFAVRVATGAFYYQADHRRTVVEFSDDLRQKTEDAIGRLHQLLDKGKTPRPVYRREKCDRCSLVDLCLPRSLGTLGRPVRDWIAEQIEAGRRA